MKTRHAIPLIVAACSVWGAGSPAPAQSSSWQQRSPANSPRMREDGAMAYDSTRGVVVLFGGRNESGNLLADTWEWNGADWTERFPPVSPRLRDRHRMVFDARRGVAVLSGGTDPASARYGDMWEWDGTTWTERRLATLPPSRHSFGMAYDNRRGHIVLFAGRGGGGLLDDMWRFDGNGWSQVVPTSGTPARRARFGFVYDSKRDRFVLHGGEISGGVLATDTWEFDGARWTRRFPARSPSMRIDFGTVYDPHAGRTFVHGGETPNGESDETWRWNGSDWSRVLAQPGGPFRRWPIMAYDSGRRHTVLFGGFYRRVGTSSETWEFAVQIPNPGTWARLGRGCAGSNGVPDMAPGFEQLPWIGETFAVGVSSLPLGPLSRAPVGLLGFSKVAWLNFRLPLDLGFIGMFGCLLYTDVIGTFTLANVGGNAVWPLFIPDQVDLVGGNFYQQVFVLDPGTNSLGAILSNAGDARIGQR